MKYHLHSSIFEREKQKAHTMMKQVAIVLILFALTIANAQVTREQLIAVNAALIAVNQIENQCTMSSDCALAPIGARACGGPNGYIIYSRKSSNVEYIQTLAKLTNKLEREFNADNHVISICSIVMPPKATCNKNNTCGVESFFASPSLTVE